MISKFYTLLTLGLTASKTIAQDTVCFGDDCDAGTEADDSFGFFRADDHGTDKLFNMVRALLCQKHNLEVTALNECPITKSDVEIAMRNYGCNCLPENYDDVPHTTGRLESWHMGKNGKPISEMDAACTRMRDSYTCLHIDGLNDVYQHPDEDSENPQNHCGRFTKFSFHVNSTMHIICGGQGDPEYAQQKVKQICMQKSCFIQRQFAQEVSEIIGADPVQFFNDNQSYYNVFGDDNVCVKHRTNGRQAECCGIDYPAKFPFNPLNHECCNDGTAQLTGQC